VCRDCHRLGPAELAYRQAVTNIDRALRYGQFIPRRQRKIIEQYLGHADERVRAYVADVIARDAEARRESARQRRDDELAYDAMVAFDEDIPCFDEDIPCFDEDILCFDEDILCFDEDIPCFDEDIPYFDEDIPSEMPRVSPTSPYLEATDDVAPLSQEDEEMLRQALVCLRAGSGRTIERVRQMIDAALRR
jgi:hypothetical protein